MKKTYRGSCHCKSVQYEADIDLEKGTYRCNCTFCLKARTWTTYVPKSDFRLLTSRDALKVYIDNEIGTQSFCKTCGLTSFSEGYLEEMGGDFVSVRVNFLDDVDPKDLVSGPVQFGNGLEDDWLNPPDFVGHL